jgi:hypothetical protein
VLTTRGNKELGTVNALYWSFCLLRKLKPLTKIPSRFHQILTVIIHQNLIHQKKITKLGRRERRKVATRALLENHFGKEKLEKKQKNISTKGSKDIAECET